MLTGADLLAYESEKPGQNEGSEQGSEDQGFDDEDDVPGVPLAQERIEGADAVVVGEIEQDVGESGDAGEQVEPSPAALGHRLRRVLPAAALPERVEKPDECDGDGGDEWNAKESVGDAAMLDESVGGAFEVGEDVDVGGLGGQGHGESGERGLAVESRTRQGGPG